MSDEQRFTAFLKESRLRFALEWQDDSMTAVLMNIWREHVDKVFYTPEHSCKN